MLPLNIGKISRARITTRSNFYRYINPSLTPYRGQRFYGGESLKTNHAESRPRNPWAWALGISTTLIVAYGASKSSAFESKAHGDQQPPKGLDWQGTTHPALDLESALAKVSEGETSFKGERGGSATRTDISQLASNLPVEDTWTYESADVGGDSNWQFWGVFDGHGGWATSDVLRRSLVSYVAKQLKELPGSGVDSADAVDPAIKSAFLGLDHEIISSGLNALTDSSLSHTEILSRIAPARAGSCALLAMHDPLTSLLRVACVGDSRAVLGRRRKPQSVPGGTDQTALQTPGKGWEATPLSTDQTGTNPDEIARLAKEHPGEEGVIDPKTNRILGIMVARAFGDHRWKWPASAIQDAEKGFFCKGERPNYVTPPYLVAEPVITTTKIEDGDFVILASDGLWDQMSSEDAVRLVGGWIDQNRGKTIKDVQPVNMAKETPGVEKKPKGYEWPYKAAPEYDVVEGKNAATSLMKNALGGNRRDLFCSLVSLKFPDTKDARDDITVQVVFFGK